MDNLSNQLKNYLIAWIIIMLIGIVLFMLPISYNVQPVNTAIALFVIGVLLAGTGFGMTINYSVKILKQKLSKPQLLLISEWVLSDEEWKQYCKQTFKHSIKSQIKVYYLVIAACVIIDVVLLFVLEEHTTIIDLLLSEFAFISISLFFPPLLSYFINIMNKGEVKIYDSAVMLNGVLFNWGMPQGKLIAVELLSENPPIIFFEYSLPYRRMSPMFTNTKKYYVRVPVPTYELNKADEIVNKFQKEIEET